VYDMADPRVQLNMLFKLILQVCVCMYLLFFELLWLVCWLCFKTYAQDQCYRFRDVNPESRIRIFPSRIRIKEFKYFTQKIVSKLSEIWSVLPVPDPDADPDPDFYAYRIHGSKMHRIPDLQHCSRGILGVAVTYPKLNIPVL
jgi:hypothetical protein